MTIRFAAAGDAGALLEIYAQYIDTPITFECRPPSEEEFSGRITGIAKEYPYLVCEEGGRIIGYAYAHRHMEREAYQWNAELSVYLHQSFTARGLGKTLYLILIEILKLQGIRTVYGVVTAPNAKSEGLHASLGFQLLGTCHRAGYKCGKWHDVMWFEKQIAPYDSSPKPIISINEIPGEKLDEIITLRFPGAYMPDFPMCAKLPLPHDLQTPL